MKKVVSDLKTFAHKRCKIAASKKFFTEFIHLFTPFERLFAITFQSPMSKLLDLRNPRGKQMERSDVAIPGQTKLGSRDP